MATTAPDQPGEFISERIAGGMLPRVLNTFDMVAIFVSIVLFITNAAVIQSAGPAAFGWWIIGFLAFLIPVQSSPVNWDGCSRGRARSICGLEGLRTVLGFLRGVLRVVAGRACNGGDRHSRARLPRLCVPVDDRVGQRSGAGCDHHRLHRRVCGAGQPTVPADAEHRQRGVRALCVGDRVGVSAGVVHLAGGGRPQTDPPIGRRGHRRRTPVST